MVNVIAFYPTIRVLISLEYTVLVMEFWGMTKPTRNGKYRMILNKFICEEFFFYIFLTFGLVQI